MEPRRTKDLPQFLRIFFLDPIGTMRRPLVLTWPAIISLVVSAAAISGAVVGALGHNVSDFLLGLFLFPVTSLMITLVFSFFIYYFFSLFRSTFLEFQRLVTLVAVALLPYFLLHSVSGLLSPIDLIGFALAMLLLVVGLVEQFDLDRRVCAKLMTGIAAAFFIIWSITQYRTSTRSAQETGIPAPRPLGEIEDEIK